jgi:hypothetical protein
VIQKRIAETLQSRLDIVLQLQAGHLTVEHRQDLFT